mgnify:CR=1 FL=1
MFIFKPAQNVDTIKNSKKLECLFFLQLTIESCITIASSEILMKHIEKLKILFLSRNDQGLNPKNRLFDKSLRR